MASIFNCRGCQLWDHHVVLNIQDGGDDSTCQGGQVIDVGMANLAQQTVQAESFQETANATSTPTSKQRAQATRSQPGQRMLSTQECLQYTFVLLQKRMEPPVTAALLVVSGPTQARGILLTGGMLPQAGQPLAIAFDPRLHEVRQIAQTIDALFHRGQALLFSLILMYHLSVVLKKRHVVGRHFQPEDASGSVVMFPRSGAKAELEPQSRVTSSQMAGDLSIMAHRQ